MDRVWMKDSDAMTAKYGGMMPIFGKDGAFPGSHPGPRSGIQNTNALLDLLREPLGCRLRGNDATLFFLRTGMSRFFTPTRPCPRTPILTLLLVLLLVFAAVRPAAAQDPPGVTNQLGVYEAIDLARARSPKLHQLRQQVDAKGGEWLTSFGLNAPELVYAKEGITGGAYDERRWGISQTIDFPLQSYYRLRQVDTQRSALSLDVEAALNDLTVAVKKAYTQLLYTQEILHLRLEEVRLARALQDAASVRVEVGEASELELMKADIGLAEAESKLEAASQQFQNARYALFNVIGLDPEEQVYEIHFPDTLAYINITIDQEHALQRIAVQPEMQSAVMNQEAARLGIRKTRSALLPGLKVDLFRQDYGTGYDQFGFQVGLSVPLWLFSNHRGRMQMARAEAQRWSWQQQAVSLDLKKEIEQVWHSYETSKRTIERYQTAIRGRADELLRLTQEGYRIGELDLLTLLDTQRTYLASQQRYYDALHDYYFHLIDLERYLGEDIVFNPEYIPAVQASE